MHNNNPATRGGCFCERNEDLLTSLRQIDFAIIEVTLYLDVYPDCCEAREYIRELREKRAKLAAEYESRHGMLTMYGICGESSDKCAPWPWEYAAN
jgi:spore coat protein JB